MTEDFIDLGHQKSTVIPVWLRNAVDAIKFAAGVPSILGVHVDELARQITRWAQRPLKDDEDLPDDIDQVLKNCIAYNDALEKKKDRTTGEPLSRQSVNSLIVKGKWREAPGRRMEKAGRNDVLTVPTQDRIEAEKLAWKQKVALEFSNKEAVNMMQWGWTPQGEPMTLVMWNNMRDQQREAFKDMVLRRGAAIPVPFREVLKPMLVEPTLALPAPMPTMADLQAALAAL